MLPARRTDPAHDQALTAALDRLTGGVPDRADTPDAWITAVRRLAPLEARYAPFGTQIDARLCDVLRQRGVDQLYTHQAAGDRSRARRSSRRGDDADRVGKTLCYNAPVLSTILRDPSARALYLFPTKALAQDQLAELHELSDLLSRRDELRDRRVHLRRRHAAGCAARDSRPRARRAEQSGHGALRHPAASSAMGEALREPALCRDRRAARVSRRVRQSSHERAAPPQSDLPALRIDADVRLLVGDDRQPARAGRGARRAAVRAGLGERCAARREVLPLRQPAGRQRAARHPAVVSGRNTAARVRVPEAEAADDRVRAEPPRDGDPDDVSQGRLRRPPGHRRTRSAATGAGICRSGGARSRRGFARAASAPWSRPTRWSWASTSARSTCA